MKISNFEELEYYTKNEKRNTETHGAVTVGIDIGTTTISAVVWDLHRMEQLESYTIEHNSYLCTEDFSEQSVDIILEKGQKLLQHILDNHTGIVSIGLTGQMHGIVYLDRKGNPLSNLMNWQDKRGDRLVGEGESACQRIKRITGEPISTGYGLATHYYNLCHGLVPENTACFCSIMDLFGMKICGLTEPLIHTSVAASFGLFDVKDGTFQEDLLVQLGIGKEILPAVTGESCKLGTCGDIPVSVALGDNQASFLGSVSENKESVLVNIGTGSQISVVSDYREVSGDVEVRPFVEGRYLLCGSALCGGYAYAMLEQFFRTYIVAAGGQNKNQYKILNRLAAEAYEANEAGLSVDVSFLGKRSDPYCRGSVTEIDRQNFNPSGLILGVLKGMCNELFGLYKTFSENKTQIVASGGAVKKNVVLQKLLEDSFGVPVSVCNVDEEAATGAALFSAFVSGKLEYHNGFSKCIHHL